jgi:hypothetical protein
MSCQSGEVSWGAAVWRRKASPTGATEENRDLRVISVTENHLTASIKNSHDGANKGLTFALSPCLVVMSLTDSMGLFSHDRDPKGTKFEKD